MISRRSLACESARALGCAGVAVARDTDRVGDVDADRDGERVKENSVSVVADWGWKQLK